VNTHELESTADVPEPRKEAMTSSYVKSITIPGTVGNEPLPLAFPEPPQTPHVINVLCGQNNTGKSYVLDGLRKCLQLRWAHLETDPPHTREGLVQMDDYNGLHKGDIYVAMTARSPRPTVLSFRGSSWQNMSRAGTVALSRSPKKAPTNDVSYSELYFKFIHEQLGRVAVVTELPRLDEWINDQSARFRTLQCLQENDTLYKCSSESDLIGLVENILGGHLYLRYVKVGSDGIGQIDFCIVYPDGSSRVYTEWSDGQRAVFYFLTLIDQVRPDILLLDEIENHLHPAYISQVLEFVRKNTAQAILTTHHPHVVFSNLVDKVVYIEATRLHRPATAESEVAYVTKQYQSAPQRSLHTLDTDFEKLNSVYQLFAQHDRQLLLQAERVLCDAEIVFYSAIAEIYRNEVRAAGSRPTPDAQSAQLVGGLKRLGLLQSGGTRTTILDFGAGYGRTQREIGKLSLWRLGAGIDWVCWERDPSDREILRRQLAEVGTPALVPNRIDDVADASVDACTLVNVLHHLTPDAFEEVVGAAIRKTSSDGALIILELYPLLSAEKFAVQYPPNCLLSIFRSMGLTASCEMTPVRDTTAYCLVATGAKLEELRLRAAVGQISTIVSDEWDAVLEDAVCSYAQRGAVGDYRGLRDLMGALTTIASVSAWRQGVWT